MKAATILLAASVVALAVAVFATVHLLGKLDHRVSYLECVQKQGGPGQESSMTARLGRDGKFHQSKAAVTGCAP